MRERSTAEQVQELADSVAIAFVDPEQLRQLADRDEDCKAKTKPSITGFERAVRSYGVVDGGVSSDQGVGCAANTGGTGRRSAPRTRARRRLPQPSFFLRNPERRLQT
jgi:hypothetical protein